MGAVSEDLLRAFKERMRIFHDVEDDNLRRIVAGSVAALSERFGLPILDKDSGVELVLERSRYVYNDRLEGFEMGFAAELNRFALVHTLEGEKDASSNKETLS